MANKLKEGALSKIRYRKGSETTERVIVPSIVPGNIKALDVSDLPEEQQEAVVKLFAEYQKYMTLHMITAFTFEDWVEQSKGFEVTPKWRTFKPENTDVL